MRTGTLTFLFNSGQIVQESWHFNATSPEDAIKTLRLVAQARRVLLAASIRIALLKVTGQPPERVNWTGKGGIWASPRQALVLRHEGRAVKKQLRGVPQELCNGKGLTPDGLQAFQSFNRILNQCGCLIVRTNEQPETIRKLAPDHLVTLLWKKGIPATKKKIVALLGVEEGQRFWDSMKVTRTGARVAPS